MIKISQYDPLDEEKWLQCLFTSYCTSSYFDELIKVKPRYETPSVELVGILKDDIVGILDIEIEQEAGQFCFDENERSGMISIIGVLSQYRRRGIATKLVEKSLESLQNDHNVHRLEISVRDEPGTIAWLKKNRFQEIYRFFEVLLTTDFFDKYNIDLPFGITPTFLKGNIESEGFSKLTQQHPPERTYPIIIFEKCF